MRLSRHWTWVVLPLFWVAMVGCETDTVDDDLGPDVNVETDSATPGGTDVDVTTPPATDDMPATMPPSSTDATTPPSSTDATTPPASTDETPSLPNVDVDVNTGGDAGATDNPAVPDVDIDAGAATGNEGG